MSHTNYRSEKTMNSSSKAHDSTPYHYTGKHDIILIYLMLPDKTKNIEPSILHNVFFFIRIQTGAQGSTSSMSFGIAENFPSFRSMAGNTCQRCIFRLTDHILLHSWRIETLIFLPWCEFRKSGKDHILLHSLKIAETKKAITQIELSLFYLAQHARYKQKLFISEKIH